MPELAISAEKVGFLIEKAREFDVKDDVADPDSGSNASDDKMIDMLENHGDDPVVREITGFIGALSQDEQIALVALIGLAVATVAWRNGASCAARRPREPTAAPRAICSASRCSATFLLKGSTSSD